MIHYKEGFKYQLVKPFSIQILIFPDEHIVTKRITLSVSGDLTILDGYAWDGPSGPTVDTKSAMRGSLIHDAIYQLIREKHLSEKLRKTTDDIYREICIQDGMWKIRAAIHFNALRMFGGSAASPHSKKKVLTAP